MRKYLSTVAVVLGIAACGGGGGGDSNGGAGGGDGRTWLAPNVWEEADGSICVRYRPNPLSSPEERVDCVPEDWPSTSVCWRTQDEPECYNGDGREIAVGCVAIAENWVGAAIGEVSVGCVIVGDCIADAIDNPPCCEETERPGSRAAWDCATN